MSTSIDPVVRAKNDVFQGNLEFDVTDTVKFVSQTAYARDRYFSTQDYNRYVSAPIFNDTLGLVDGPPQIIIPMPPPLPPLVFGEEPLPIDQTYAAPGGIFCDTQLGCSDRILSMDLSRSRSDERRVGKECASTCKSRVSPST